MSCRFFTSLCKKRMELVQPVKFIAHKVGPIDHIELAWDPHSRGTLIIGDNGTGKTTLIKAIGLCHTFNAQNLNRLSQIMRDEESWLFWEHRFGTESYRFYCYHKNNLSPIPFKEETHAPIKDGWVLSFSNRSIVNYERLTQFIVAGYGANRQLHTLPQTTYKELPISASLRSTYADPSSPIDSNRILQWIINQHFKRALALSDQQTEEAEQYLASIKRVEQFFSEGLEMSIKFELQRNPLKLIITHDGKPLDIEQLSDGTISLLSWTLDYLQKASEVNWADSADAGRAPGLILLDEIDSHLHPEWQRRVLPLAQKLLPYTHIIATTHSPFVVGSGDDVQLFRLYRDEQNQIQVVATYDDYYGLPADLILEKAFVTTLYPPELDRKLNRLRDLVSKVMGKIISADERLEHDQLLEELAPINPWVNNLKQLADRKKSSHDLPLKQYDLKSS